MLSVGTEVKNINKNEERENVDIFFLFFNKCNLCRSNYPIHQYCHDKVQQSVFATQSDSSGLGVTSLAINPRRFLIDGEAPFAISSSRHLKLRDAPATCIAVLPSAS